MVVMTTTVNLHDHDHVITTNILTIRPIVLIIIFRAATHSLDEMDVSCGSEIIINIIVVIARMLVVIS
jgi:hypothetical protein